MFRFSALATATLLALGSVAMAEGNVKAGKKVFKKCAACHTVKEGKHKVGPSLYQIIGSTAGAIDGFKYSTAMVDSGVTWDDESLTAFLKAPKAFIPKNRMAFPGLKKDQQIEDVIAYIRSKSE